MKHPDNPTMERAQVKNGDPITHEVGELAAPAEILIDRYGFPHIYAADAHDALFTQDFCIAGSLLTLGPATPRARPASERGGGGCVTQTSRSRAMGIGPCGGGTRVLLAGDDEARAEYMANEPYTKYIHVISAELEPMIERTSLGLRLWRSKKS